MEIKVKTSLELSQEEWESYVVGFNQVFSKSHSVDMFLHKYLNTIDSFSYHSLLYNEGNIVGGCTVIPFNYVIKGQLVRVGLAVDVFICEKFRIDIFALLKLYKKIKEKLINHNISIVVAVPNDVSYRYWKSVVKWKDIGQLNYYVYPLNFGNLVNKYPPFLNFVSRSCLSFFLLLFRYYNITQKRVPIFISRNDEVIYKHRYTIEHKLFTGDDYFASYRLIDENGIKACYLIDFYNLSNGLKDFQSIRKFIIHVRKTEHVDVIIFVGILSFFQCLLFKVPRKFEPKHLYFTIDILIPNIIKDDDLIYNVNNWDFGLFNYDVR